MWLARNNWIFNSNSSTPRVVASKAKTLISEFVSKTIKNSSLPPEIVAWLGSSTIGRSSIIIKPLPPPSKHVRLSVAAYPSRWKSSSIATIFFNDAFNWDVGISLNNQAESYNLLKSCHIAKDRILVSSIFLGTLSY